MSMINETKAVRITSIGQYIKKLSFDGLKNKYELAKFVGGKPIISFEIGTKQEQIGETDHEVVLLIEAVSKMGERNEEVFKVRLEYAGIFRLEGEIEQIAKEEILLVNCITLLFPFARRELAEITLGGGYQPVMLDPIDFSGAYLQYKQKLANENGKLVTTGETVQFNH